MGMLKSQSDILFDSNGSNVEAIRLFAVRTTSLIELEHMVRDGRAAHRR
ncbi:MAG: hypothetical protein PHO64_11830 [Thiomonas sp.]|nr:hypothetical protein [Thiomonas sp.]